MGSPVKYFVQRPITRMLLIKTELFIFFLLCYLFTRRFSCFFFFFTNDIGFLMIRLPIIPRTQKVSKYIASPQVQNGLAKVLNKIGS